MKIFKKIAIATGVAMIACSAQAGSSSGKVTTLIINSSNFLFFTAGVKTGSPSCGNNNQWAINLATAQGKTIYALLLSAQAQDRTVSVFGNNACNNWGDREDVLYATSD
ncbi:MULTISPECIES: hypothetical protein [Acidovorax]|uniref:hypothetical protein n=1 Tax=Acidovorax TaxID=12916 RepID=UPI000AA85DC9|nr:MULTISPECIES: hypothetical protein [Acidovorax]MBD9393520.1 hypothetical protein [Acidovorax sp. ACV01]